MNFTYVEFPCTVNLNTFKAYFNLNRVILPKIYGKTLTTPSNQDGNGSDVATNHAFKSLRHLVLDSIIENWNEIPFYKELPRREDRNYVLTNLDVNLPLKLLSAHIKDNFFWRKSYQHRWKVLKPTTPAATTAADVKPWINIYMERHLQEFIENLETSDYEQDNVQTELDICAAHINHLEINCLQPSMGERNDHIPLDFILSNLPELHTLRITYCTKTVGTNFYLGCNTMSQRDIILLARGLSHCYELKNFCLHSTKLEPYQLQYIARSLDKGCHHITSLSLVHCTLGDEGIRQFLESCTKESFGTLKILDLTNNKISSEGAFMLSRTFRGHVLEELTLRLNPIGSDGAAAIFSMIHFLPLRILDLSACLLCQEITKLFMQLIVQNKTLTEIYIANNDLGEDFGKHLFKIIGFNRILEYIDFRNTGISLVTRNQFKEILDKNKRRSEFKKKVVSFRL